MKLINRYLSKTVLTNTLGVLLVVSGIDLIFNLLDGVNDLKGDYGFLQLIVYLLLYLPEQINFFLPVAILVGVLIGLGSLAATSELTVIRAAGASIPRIIFSAFKPIIYLLILALLASEFVIPQTNQLAKTYRWEKINQTSKSNLVKESNLWLKEDNKIYSINLAQDNGVIHGLNVFTLNDDWELSSLITAKKAKYVEPTWHLSQIRQIHFSNTDLIEEHLEALQLTLPLEPENLALLALHTEEIALSRLKYFASYLQAAGQPSGYYWLAFWKASLLPLTVFSVVLLGASFTFGPLRSVPAGTRVFHGIVIALGVKFTQDLLGPATILWDINPIFAVLLPAAFCAGLGMLFIYKAR